jgi:ABC-type phosphate transport system auxiliary subunit
MPAKSAKQEKFMRAVAENPKFAKKVGVPQSVGREFTKSGGGEMKESKAMMKKEVAFMKKKGAPKAMVKHEMKEAGMKYGGKVKKMASGGLAAGHKSADGVASKGKTKAKQVVMAGSKGMKYGGKC